MTCLHANVRNTNIGMGIYLTELQSNTNGLVAIIDAIDRERIKAMHKQREARRLRVKRGATLRPCDDTGLWNALISLVEPRLRRRGTRALLARELGVHRARIGEYFQKKSAMPDAERTLRLLLWLSRQPAKKSTAAF